MITKYATALFFVGYGVSVLMNYQMDLILGIIALIAGVALLANK